ncbi:MAG: hypothetical protein OXJ52_06475 [Oligoflexia bacterium]|nr:hypothetical protein [Oligoflexia bacterium]
MKISGSNWIPAPVFPRGQACVGKMRNQENSNKISINTLPDQTFLDSSCLSKKALNSLF